MKILVYVPLNPWVPRIYARTLTSVLTMQWNEPVDVVLGRADREPDGINRGHDELTSKHNQARHMVLELGYDALLLIESDVIVPPLTLERLTRVDADVAYGLYISRHGHRKWLAYDHVHESGTGASMSDIPMECPAAWGNVIETKGVGLGCTLIHRHVLEALEFRCPDHKTHDDWYFALDCQAHNFVQKHDCGVVCGHIQGTPDPKILWPEPDGGYSVQFFDNMLPDTVQITPGYQVVIDKIGIREMYQPPPIEMFG